MPYLEDRRRKRSVDPLIALHYQLAHARTDGALDAIVVADASGVVVAGAGSWATCEELAAYAPLLASAATPQAARLGEPIAGPIASRVESLRREVDVRTMLVDGQEVLLCARGGALRAVSLEQAAQGVARILSRAA